MHEGVILNHVIPECSCKPRRNPLTSAMSSARCTRRQWRALPEYCLEVWSQSNTCSPRDCHIETRRYSSLSIAQLPWPDFRPKPEIVIVFGDWNFGVRFDQYDPRRRRPPPLLSMSCCDIYTARHNCRVVISVLLWYLQCEISTLSRYLSCSNFCRVLLSVVFNICCHVFLIQYQCLNRKKWQTNGIYCRFNEFRVGTIGSDVCLWFSTDIPPCRSPTMDSAMNTL